MDRDTEGRSGDDSNDANSIPLNNLRFKSLADLAKLSNHLPINWDELPRVPFFGLLLGYNDQYYRAAVSLGVLETRWRGDCSLTSEEVQVVSSQVAKCVATTAYEVPALFGCVYWYEHRGRSKFRFPFYTPGEGFNPNAFPTDRFAFLKGSAARSSWHLLRVLLYTSAAHFGLRILFTAYAINVKNYEFENDPRLSDLRAAIRKHTAEIRKEHASNAPGLLSSHGPKAPPLGSSDLPQEHEKLGADYATQAAEEPQAETQTQAQKAQSGWLPLRNKPQRPQPVDPQQQQQYQQQYQKLQSLQHRQPPQQAYRPPASSDNDHSDDVDGFDSPHDTVPYDDGSPVSPSVQRRAWQQAAETSGVSAWDRIRDHSASGQPQHTGWTSRWGPSSKKPKSAAETEEYTRSWTGGEKVDPRSQAQKEFDEMLERERRGEGVD